MNRKNILLMIVLLIVVSMMSVMLIGCKKDDKKDGDKPSDDDNKKDDIKVESIWKDVDLSNVDEMIDAVESKLSSNNFTFVQDVKRGINTISTSKITENGWSESSVSTETNQYSETICIADKDANKTKFYDREDKNGKYAVSEDTYDSYTYKANYYKELFIGSADALLPTIVSAKDVEYFDLDKKYVASLDMDSSKVKTELTFKKDSIVIVMEDVSTITLKDFGTTKIVEPNAESIGKQWRGVSVEDADAIMTKIRTLIEANDFTFLQQNEGESVNYEVLYEINETQYHGSTKTSSVYDEYVGVVVDKEYFIYNRKDTIGQWTKETITKADMDNKRQTATSQVLFIFDTIKSAKPVYDAVKDTYVATVTSGGSTGTFEIMLVSDNEVEMLSNMEGQTIHMRLSKFGSTTINVPTDIIA